MKSLLTIVVLFSMTAFAKDPAYVGILEFPDFKNLRADQKTLYLHGLQSIASGLNQIHAKKVSYPKGRLPASEPLCEYAGFLVQKTLDGGCPTPPRGSCPSGMIQCEPFLFGEGICAKEGPGASLQCRENSRPASEILKLIEKNPAGWDKVSRELGAYCEDNSQQESCFYIRGRLWELNKMVDMQTPPPLDVLASGGGRDPIRTWGDFNRSNLTAPPATAAAASPGVIATDRGATGEKKAADDAKKEEEVALERAKENAKKCQTSALTAQVRCSEKEDPEAVMNISEVSRIFCERQTITDGELEAVKARLKRMDGCLRNVIAKSKGYQKSKAEASLESLRGSVTGNFDRCIADLRAGKTIASNKIATLRRTGGTLTVSPDDRKISAISTDEEYFGIALGAQGVQVCQLRMEGFDGMKPLKSGTGVRGRR